MISCAGCLFEDDFCNNWVKLDTPFELALKTESFEAAQFLFDHGSQVNSILSYLQTDFRCWEL